MESIKNILAITGKPGLYKLVSRGNNMLIVESLVDGKHFRRQERRVETGSDGCEESGQ